MVNSEALDSSLHFVKMIKLKQYLTTDKLGISQNTSRDSIANGTTNVKRIHVNSTSTALEHRKNACE